MSDEDDRARPQRKRRTREHVIEDLSGNHLERQVLLNGHVLRRPDREYGVDVTMFHFSSDGEIENGEVRFQLKATEKLNVINAGTEISYPIKTGDLHYWALEIYPFILVVFDAKNEEAFWLDVGDYVDGRPEVLDPSRETVNVRIPRSNRLTVQSIEHFRNRSLQIVTDLRNQGGFQDAAKRAR